MTLFKIEDLFVEEKKLGKLLWALDGLAVGKPYPVPVRGAKVHGSKIKAVSSGGTVPEMVKAYIVQNGITEVDAEVMRRIVVEQLGCSPHTAPNARWALTKEKFLRLKKGTKGKFSKYTVHPK
jgi:hypothetical protein